MDDKVKTDLKAFLMQVNGEDKRARDERRAHIARENAFIKQFHADIDSVIEPAMKEFLAELDGSLGVPECEIEHGAIPSHPSIGFIIRAEPNPGIQPYGGKAPPPPQFTLRANPDTLKIDIDVGGYPAAPARCIDLSEITAVWLQAELLVRLKEVVTVG
jgi:hypothetical protein